MGSPFRFRSDNNRAIFDGKTDLFFVGDFQYQQFSPAIYRLSLSEESNIYWEQITSSSEIPFVGMSGARAGKYVVFWGGRDSFEGTLNNRGIRIDTEWSD